MKLLKPIGWSSALCLIAMNVQAQETNQVDLWQKQLRQVQEQFKKIAGEQRRQIEALQHQIQVLQRSQATAASNAVATSRAAQPEAPPSLDSPGGSAGVKPSWSLTEPVRLLGGQRSYLDLSLDGLFAAGASTANDVGQLQLGDHDPSQRGFTLQNLEATFTGAVDPYLRGQSSIVFGIDPDGETKLEVEEAYLETMSLPGNLQLRAGQFFTEFGRLNPTHPHTWDFVDQPLVNGRFFGPDGLRNPGARLSWLAPTPFYSEFYLAVQNSQGETAHSFRSTHEGDPFLGRAAPEAGRLKSFGDLLFVPRYALAFDLTPSQTVLAGASAALGPNASGSSTDTQIYGIDLFWKWKPVTHSGGFPFVSWQSEAMLRRYQAGAFSEDLDGNGWIDAGEPDWNGDGIVDSIGRETLTDYGFYSQLAYGFRKGWVAGLRGDYVTPDRPGRYEAVFDADLDRATRWRISPNVTWYPSEFSKLRLQYNYNDRDQIGADHSVWLQFEFLLGAHAAHKF